MLRHCHSWDLTAYHFNVRSRFSIVFFWKHCQCNISDYMQCVSMTAYKPLSHLYWFPKPTSLTLCRWQSSHLGLDTCNKSIWLMRSVHWLIRVLRGTSGMIVERFAHTEQKHCLTKAFDASLSFFAQWYSVMGYYTYSNCQPYLGQKHKRQAEAPNASRSNMYTVQS